MRTKGKLDWFINGLVKCKNFVSLIQIEALPPCFSCASPVFFIKLDRMINPRLISFVLLFISPKGKLGRNSLEISNLHIYEDDLFCNETEKPGYSEQDFFLFPLGCFK